MIRYILTFIGVLIAQILVFNQIQFSGFVNPAFYILFVIILPINTSAWLRLSSAFLLGFLVDIFSQSSGIHTASILLIAYLQPFILKNFQTTEIDEDKSSSLSFLGFQWFILAGIVMVILHQTVYFLLEVFSFRNFLETLYRIGLSSFATFTVVFLAQLITYRKQQ